MSDQRVNGVVKKVLPDKGYGFVTADLDAPAVGGVDHFFHRSDLVGGHGLYFPTDRCVCGCTPVSHVGSNGVGKPFTRGHCLACTRCSQYEPAKTAHALQPGTKLSFVSVDDEKGPRATRIQPPVLFAPSSCMKEGAYAFA